MKVFPSSAESIASFSAELDNYVALEMGTPATKIPRLIRWTDDLEGHGPAYTRAMFLHDEGR